MASDVLPALTGARKEVVAEDIFHGVRTVRWKQRLGETGQTIEQLVDIRHLVALVAPRPVTFPAASDRVKTELEGLKAVYKAAGKNFDPLE